PCPRKTYPLLSDSIEQGDGDDKGDTSAIHARVQAGSGSNGRVGPKHSSSGTKSGRGWANVVQLGQGEAGRTAEGSGQQQGGKFRANGNQSIASRVGAGEDGARHPGKSDGVLRKR